MPKKKQQIGRRKHSCNTNWFLCLYYLVRLQLVNMHDLTEKIWTNCIYNSIKIKCFKSYNDQINQINIVKQQIFVKKKEIKNL